MIFCEVVMGEGDEGSATVVRWDGVNYAELLSVVREARSCTVGNNGRVWLNMIGRDDITLIPGDCIEYIPARITVKRGDGKR